MGIFGSVQFKREDSDRNDPALQGMRVHGILSAFASALSAKHGRKVAVAMWEGIVRYHFDMRPKVWRLYIFWRDNRDAEAFASLFNGVAGDADTGIEVVHFYPEYKGSPAPVETFEYDIGSQEN